MLECWDYKGLCWETVPVLLHSGIPQGMTCLLLKAQPEQTLSCSVGSHVGWKSEALILLVQHWLKSCVWCLYLWDIVMMSEYDEGQHAYCKVCQAIWAQHLCELKRVALSLVIGTCWVKGFPWQGRLQDFTWHCQLWHIAHCASLCTCDDVCHWCHEICTQQQIHQVCYITETLKSPLPGHQQHMSCGSTYKSHNM